MVRINGHTMDNEFKSLHDMNKLYNVWKEVKLEG